jgi:hypothetical protein
MADSNSNIDELNAEIRALIKRINFNLTVGGAALGRALVDKIAWDINRRSINFQQDGDGIRWTPNATAYAKWKLEHYGSNKVGAMTGQMLSLLSLKGQAAITDLALTMTYGIDRPSDRASVTNPPRSGGRRASASKPQPTDREKAGWFEEGDPGRNRDPRTFYELDDAIEDDIEQLVGEYLDKLLSS